MKRVLFLFVSVAMCFCSRNNDGSNIRNDNAGRMPDGMHGNARGGIPREYHVLTLLPLSVTVYNEFPATIEGQQVIEIRPMISGYIEEICVNEGDFVRKGQMLFRIRNPQYEQAVITAKASVASAEADVNSSGIEVEKIRPLVERDIVSKYRLESAELTLKTKEALLEQARAALANAEANLAYTLIKSPQDGAIGTIPYKTGALVSSTNAEALTLLSDISNIYAYFSWNEKQLLAFFSQAPGVTVREKLKSMPYANLILADGTEYDKRGMIEMASSLISPETGSATLKAVFANPDFIIRSGSSATVKIPSLNDSVLLIPQSATYELQDQRFVYRVNDDHTVTAINFKSVETNDGQYFIVTKGMNPGDRIVTEGVVSLRDGVKIIPMDTSAVSFYGKMLNTSL